MTDFSHLSASLDGDALRRVVIALLAEELGRLRGRALDASEWRSWTGATRLDEDGMGADSLSRLEMAARLNAFFHLHETGVEDYLLISPDVDEWVNLISKSLQQSGSRLTFQTSGSTGPPKHITHEAKDLIGEALAHSVLFQEIQRVICLTPPHHIYGFIFSIIMPAYAGAEVVDLRGVSLGRLAAELRSGDLVVTTPFMCNAHIKSRMIFPPGVTVVVSTAPCSQETWLGMKSASVSRMIEVYGSTETAGVGWREAHNAPFNILPHLERGSAAPTELFRRRNGARINPPDTIAWTEGGAFRPIDRCDGAVQVGGVNVFPDQVRQFLEAQPGVAECLVRLDCDGPAARIKVFVVLSTGFDYQIEAMLRQKCNNGLAAPARPIKYRFGETLPKNDFGKLIDWV